MSKSKEPSICPIDLTASYIGKKWMIQILRDMFNGKNRFSDFLKANSALSTKMLSERLQELEKKEFIEKKVVSTTPLVAEYHLTTKGKAIGPILYEFAAYSINNCKTELHHDNKTRSELLKIAKDFFIDRRELSRKKNKIDQV